MGSGISELYGDALYHPYMIVVDNFVYVSGSFALAANISTDGTIIFNNLVGPTKKRWVPLHNMSTGQTYHAHINSNGTTLTINTLPAGNYSVSFGYQRAYGGDI
jgi:hypothetical protein